MLWNIHVPGLSVSVLTYQIATRECTRGFRWTKEKMHSVLFSIAVSKIHETTLSNMSMGSGFCQNCFPRLNSLQWCSAMSNSAYFIWTGFRKSSTATPDGSSWPLISYTVLVIMKVEAKIVDFIPAINFMKEFSGTNKDGIKDDQLSVS